MVKIIADTTSAILPEVARRYQIPVIPQVIYFGDECYIEVEEIDNATFLKKLHTSPTLPKTAAPPPELFIKEFQRLVPTGETILCIHPSIKVSGNVRSALIAKKEFPDADIRVIDTQLVSSPLASVVECAAEWAEAGLDADTIEARVMEMSKHCHMYAMVATLEYLAKGGRIGGAAALLGSVLQVKPILTLRDGQVETYEKERTHKRGMARLKELVLTQIPKEEAYLTVMHAGVQEEAAELAKFFMAELGLKKVPIHDVPPAITTHAGPGLIGVGFFVK